MKKLAVLLLTTTLYSLAGQAEEGIDKQCVPEGAWVNSVGKQVANSDIIKTLSRSKVILIGEDHENAEHHRMQLHTMAQIYAEQPNMALGFEAFPRKAQKYLDQWVRGELDENEFIKLVEWEEVWRFNKDHYLPMFHFARMNKIPMVALNVERRLVSEVGNKGWDNVPPELREGISKPAPANSDYIEVLASVFAQHMPQHGQPGDESAASELSASDISDIISNPSFQKFMQGQLVWDRAMAEALADIIKKQKKSIVVGIMGAGHVMGDYGVGHQLIDLGIPTSDSITLMPWDGSVECEQLKNGAFDYAFGIKYFAPEDSSEKDYPRLGVFLEHNDGVIITRLVKGGIAESMGIHIDDKIIKIAGKPVEKVADVVDAVKSTAFGTWLPLVIARDGKELEMVAKFSPKE